jgi:Protein of unknown function (DUF4065)
MNWEKNRNRLKQLILYIVEQMKDAPYFGETKLNKVLFRSEFAAFRDLGAVLTHYRYVKNKFGPTLSAYLPIVSEMEREGLLAWQVQQQGTREERRPILPDGVSWDRRAFSKAEIDLVEEEVRRAFDQTARELSDEEHSTAAWFATRMGEQVSPELSLVEDPGSAIPLSDEENEWASAAIERYRSRAATL